MPTASATFPKSCRLLRRSDFTRLGCSNRVVNRAAFIIVWQDFGIGAPRIGITASRKVGGAVVRNRIKRRVREFYRQNRHTLPPVDVNLIARRKAADMDADTFYNELVLAFRRIGDQ